MSYTYHYGREIQAQAERQHSYERMRESADRLGPGEKECTGNVMSAGFLGFVGGSLTGVILGGILVGAGVAATTAAIASGVGAVVVGVVIAVAVLYCIFRK